jgi:hypothetical protein
MTKTKPSQVFEMTASAMTAETTTKMLGILRLTKPIAGSKNYGNDNNATNETGAQLKAGRDLRTERYLRKSATLKHLALPRRLGRECRRRRLRQNRTIQTIALR